MTTSVTRLPFLIQNENLETHCKKAASNFDEKTKSSKTTTAKKMGAAGLGSGKTRKALGDITNKPSSTLNGASSKNNNKKKNVVKDEFNIADERFLHDHNKCIKEQQTNYLTEFHLDFILPPRHDFPTASQQPLLKEPSCCYPEPEELFMSEFDDWLGSSTPWQSPPFSPVHQDSPKRNSFAWGLEEVEFSLKLED
ncbi:hypothetical protein ACFE04_007844 [Oxalis oulophora]